MLLAASTEVTNPILKNVQVSDLKQESFIIVSIASSQQDGNPALQLARK
jgi:hypothetical protein